MAKVSRTRQAVLGFLTWGPMSGYDIKKAVEGSISNFWKESYGQIYPILRRLTEEGLARKSTRPSPGGRDRHIYAITDAGREDLHRWFREPTPPPPSRHELLLKLFFGRQTDPATRLAQVEAFAEHERENLTRYARIRAELEKGAARQPDLPYWLLTLRYGEIESQSRIAWCAEALDVLGQAARLDRDRSDSEHESSPEENARVETT